MRTSKIFMPFATVLLYFIAVAGLSTAGDEHTASEKSKLTGTVEPAISAAVNVIDANSDIEREDYAPNGPQQEQLLGQAGYIVASADVDPQTGRFEISNLEPGTYKVEIEPHDLEYDRKEIEDVEVNEGEEKDLGEISLDEADTFDEEQEW